MGSVGFLPQLPEKKRRRKDDAEGRVGDRIWGRGVGKEVLGRPPYPALQYGNYATIQEGPAQGPVAGSTGGHTGRAKRLEGDPSPQVKEVGEGGPWEVSRAGVTCHGRAPAP